MSRRKCCLSNCRQSHKDNVSLFAFPISEERRNLRMKFCDGSMGTAYLGAIGITINFYTLVCVFGMGPGIAWLYRVGRLLGQGDADSARRTKNAAFVTAILCAILLGSITLAGMAFIPDLFTNDLEIRRLTLEMFPFIVCFVINNVYKTQLASIARGCGRHLDGAVISFICLTVIPLSLSIPMTFYTNLHFYGWGIPAIIGGFLNAFGFTILLLRLNWETEVVKAAERVKEKDIKHVITDSTALLTKEGTLPQNRKRGLLCKRVLAALPFFVAFSVSLVLRITSPPYGITSKANLTEIQS